MDEWYLFYPALAMTHHQLGHPGRGPPLAPYWQGWDYFEVLLQEARTLIAGNESEPPAIDRDGELESASP